MNAKAAGVYSISAMLMVVGVGFFLDCRLDARKFTADCWYQGLNIAGLGGIGASTFKMGYNTLNPKLDGERKNQLLAELQQQGLVVPTPTGEVPGAAEPAAPANPLPLLSSLWGSARASQDFLSSLKPPAKS